MWVVDGDTVEIDVDGVTEPVRLIGIDTPEPMGGFRPAECFGDEASARTRELLPEGTVVRLERDIEARDRFGRLLAYVHRSADDLFVNELLVREGFAAAVVFEPNSTYADRFADLADAAQRQGLGLWGRCGGPDREL